MPSYLTITLDTSFLQPFKNGPVFLAYPVHVTLFQLGVPSFFKEEKSPRSAGGVFHPLITRTAKCEVRTLR